MAVISGFVHRPQIADIVHLTFARYEELVVRRDAAFVLDVGVLAVRGELGDDRFHRHALDVEVADVEVDRQRR